MKKDLLKVSDIYQKAVNVLPPDYIDHYASDLYLKDTKETRQLIDELKETYACASYLIDKFYSHIDKSFWFEIPFAYIPFWEAKNKEEFY